MLGLAWEECCKQRAGIGRSTADQIIQNLEEFGSDYFAMAQVTGISANEYRRLRASINNHAWTPKAACGCSPPSLKPSTD